MTIFILLFCFALMAVLSFLIEDKHSKTKFLYNFTLLLSITTIFLYLSAVIKVPYRITFLILNLLYALFIAINYKKAVEVLKKINKREMIVFFIILLSTTFILSMRGLESWREVNSGLDAKSVWYVHSGLFENTGALGDYKQIASRMTGFQTQSVYWAAVNSYSKDFSVSAGSIFTWILFLILTFGIISNKKLYLFALPVVLLIVPHGLFATSVNSAVVVIAASAAFFALYDVIFKKASLINLLGPSLFLCFARIEGFSLLVIILCSFLIILLIEKLMNVIRFDSKHFGAVVLIVFMALILSFTLSRLIRGASNIDTSAKITLVWANYWKTTFSQSLENFYSMRGLILSFFTLFAFSPWFKEREKREKSFAAFLVFIGKFISLFPLYLFVLQEDEAQYQSYFNRFMEQVALIPLLCLLDFTPQFELRKHKIFKSLFSLVSFVAILLYFTNSVSIYKNRSEIPMGQKMLSGCRVDLKKDLKYQLIDQTASGFAKDVAVFESFPSLQVLSNDVFGPEKVKSFNEWKSFLIDKGVEFIVLYKGDDFFRENIWPQYRAYPLELPACLKAKDLIAE